MFPSALPLEFLVSIGLSLLIGLWLPWTDRSMNTVRAWPASSLHSISLPSELIVYPGIITHTCPHIIPPTALSSVTPRPIRTLSFCSFCAVTAIFCSSALRFRILCFMLEIPLYTRSLIPPTILHQDVSLGLAPTFVWIDWLPPYASLYVYIAVLRACRTYRVSSSTSIEYVEFYAVHRALVCGARAKLPKAGAGLPCGVRLRTWG